MSSVLISRGGQRTVGSRDSRHAIQNDIKNSQAEKLTLSGWLSYCAFGGRKEWSSECPWPGANLT